MTEKKLIKMLRREAQIAKSHGLLLCFRTNVASAGTASCSTDMIIDKTDEEIKAWTESWGISADKISKRSDLIW
jgi:hypothetical protein